MIAKTGKWSLVSFIINPHTTFSSITLEKILSINVALCVVILVGRVIEGYRLVLYIELMNSVVVNISKSIL